MLNTRNDYKCILLDFVLIVMSTFCVHTSTVQFSGASTRTPFTGPPTERVKVRSQSPTVITSQTRALYRALTGTTQARQARWYVQLATFGVLRSVLFPLNTSACVVVHNTTSHFYRTLSWIWYLFDIPQQRWWKYHSFRHLSLPAVSLVDNYRF
jgi:hypothetical protein